MSLATIGVVVSKHKPFIMTTLGVTGMVASGVLACRATTKIKDIKLQTASDLEAIRESGYSSEKLYRKALYKTYLAAGVSYARLYGMPILLGAASIGSIYYGYNLINKKTVALAGAYKALTMDYDGYRKRVAERFGEDNERSVAFDTSQMEIFTDDGKGHQETRSIEVIPEYMGANPTNNRSVFFDESSIYWSDDPEANKVFLMKVQEKMPKRYDRNGYLLLKDIYKELDVPLTYASTVCGWVKGYGDDEISFGIFDVYDAASRRFVNGLEPVILLNFNDEGYILDKI